MELCQFESGAGIADRKKYPQRKTEGHHVEENKHCSIKETKGLPRVTHHKWYAELCPSGAGIINTQKKKKQIKC